MISQTTSYAIFAMTCLEGPKGSFSLVKEVAEKVAIPAPYLSKIFNTLRRRGIIVAQRGVGGGVKLSKEPKEINLLDICQAMEDPFLEERCVMGLAECNDEAACPGHKFWMDEKPKICNMFEKMTLVETAESLEKKGFKFR